MERTYIKDLKSSKKAMVKGWIYEIRDMAKMKFLLIRDMTGIVQCVVKDKEILSEFSDLSLESVVEISGKTKEANVKAEFTRHDLEIEVSDFKVLSKAEDIPIDRKSTRLNSSHTDISRMPSSA